MQITGPPSRPANQRLRQGWGPGICGFIRPLGDECSGLRTAGMNEVSLPAISEREQEGKEQAPPVHFQEGGGGERAPTPSSRHTGLCPCGERGRAAGVMQHGKEMFKPGWKDGDNARRRRGPKGSGDAGDVPSSVSPLLPVPALSSRPVPDDQLPERCTATSKFGSATCMNAFPSHWKFPELPPNSLRTLFSKLSATSIELKKNLLELDA